MSLCLPSSLLSSNSLLSASLVPSRLRPELTACCSVLRRVHHVLRVIKVRALFSDLISLDPSVASNSSSLLASRKLFSLSFSVYFTE